ncbi:MAG: hypothetical protein ACK4G4_10550 [Thermus sp.]|uniref:hypothetical protein n=1 Tax=Thermus sp. TaxID=275 RepID=UPI0031FB4E27
MRVLLLLPFFFLPVWGQIDPLRPAEEPPLGFRVALGYGPFGGRGVGVDEGGPYAFTRAGHDLRLEMGLSWRATPQVSLEGGVDLSLLLLGEERAREGSRENFWRGEGALGAQVGVSYRLRELPGRPRIYLGARYPWGLGGGVSLAFLRDPVVATLGGNLDWTPGEPLVLGAVLGLGLVANEVWSLGVGASLRVPLGVEPPGGGLFLRAGYSLDPEGKGEVAVRGSLGEGGFRLRVEWTGGL